jgi:hypothetical protein
MRELGQEVVSSLHDLPWTPSLEEPPQRGRQSQQSQAVPARLTQTHMLPLYEQDLDSGYAQDQGMDTGEDLSILSGKIKAILDEEARRHGIDV